MDLDTLCLACVDAAEALIRAATASEAMQRRAALHNVLRDYILAGGDSEFLVRACNRRGVEVGTRLFV